MSNGVPFSDIAPEARVVRVYADGSWLEDRAGDRRRCHTDAVVTGRRRCGIREHREQIRSLQAQAAAYRESAAKHYQERGRLLTEADRLRQRSLQLEYDNRALHKAISNGQSAWANVVVFVCGVGVGCTIVMLARYVISHIAQ